MYVQEDLSYQDMSLVEEYRAIVFAMRTRPLKHVEEYREYYRQRFQTAISAPGRSSSQRGGRSASPLLSEPPQDAAGGAANTRHQQQQQHIDSTFPSDSLLMEVSAARKRSEAHSPSSDLTFHPQINKVSQQLQINKNYVARLYDEDIAKRNEHLQTKQQEREDAKRAQEMEESRHLALGTKTATQPTEAFVHRLYVSGRQHEHWILEEQRRQQETQAAKTKAKASPTKLRTGSSERSRERDRDVFQDLYHRAVAKQNDIKQRHVDAQNAATVLRKPSPSLHERLYDDALTRDCKLAADQEAKRSIEIDGCFQPNLELARQNSSRQIKSASPEKRSGSFRGGFDSADEGRPSVTSSAQVSARQQTASLSPVVIEQVSTLDGHPPPANLSSRSVSSPTLATKPPLAAQVYEKSITDVTSSSGTQPEISAVQAQSSKPAVTFGEATVEEAKKSARNAEEERLHQEKKREKKEKRERREREREEKLRQRPLDASTAAEITKLLGDGTKSSAAPPAVPSAPEGRRGTPPPSSVAEGRRVTPPPSTEKRNRTPPPKPAPMEDPFVNDQAGGTKEETQHQSRHHVAQRGPSLDLEQDLHPEVKGVQEEMIARKQSRKALFDSIVMLDSD